MKNFEKTTLYSQDHITVTADKTIPYYTPTENFALTLKGPTLIGLEFTTSGEIRLIGGANAGQEVTNWLLKTQRQLTAQNIYATQALQTLTKHLEWELKYVLRDKDMNSGVSNGEIQAALKLLKEYFKEE